jgi:hypothetical protein
MIMTFPILHTACSPINSMTPFDDKQAAIVAEAISGSPLAKRHQLPIKGKTKQGSNEHDNRSET